MQNIYYNVTGGEQTLVWDAPEGRPTGTPTVQVFDAETGDDGTAEVATTGAASVETNPNTTFDAASGAGTTTPRTLNLAATTGMAIGRRYLATNALGETEFVEITGITSAASAECRYSMRNAYASADTLEGTRISISVDDTWVADSNNISDDIDPNSGYRIRWTYVVDSITRVHDSYFNLVRYRADHDVAAQDVDAKRSGWIDMLPTEHKEDRGAVLIDNGYDDFKFDLHRRGIPVEILRNREVVNYMTILRTLMNSAKQQALNTGDITAYEIEREEYHGALLGLVPGKTDMDTDGSGAGTKVDALSIWER